MNNKQRKQMLAKLEKEISNASLTELSRISARINPNIMSELSESAQRKIRRSLT